MAYYTNNLSTVFLGNTINKNIISSNLYKIWLWFRKMYIKNSNGYKNYRSFF